MTIFEKIIIVLNLILTFLIARTHGAVDVLMAILFPILFTIIWIVIYPVRKKGHTNTLISKSKIFIRFYLFNAIGILTNFFIAILIFVIGYLILDLIKFLIFMSLRRTYKKAINLYIKGGFSLPGAIKNDFEKLNRNRKLNLQVSTIEKVSKKIADLKEIMDTENVAEVYSAFLYWYIFKSKISVNPKNLLDQEIIYASENMKFNEKNGYFVLKTNDKRIWK